MTEPATSRQFLYALVSAAFAIVTLVLTLGAATAGVSPTWWTVTMATLILTAAIWGWRNWQRTGAVLGISIGLMALWMVGTLVFV